MGVQHTSAAYSSFSTTPSKLAPCICTRPTIVKKNSEAKANMRFCKLQFSGSPEMAKELAGVACAHQRLPGIREGDP
jgi:hypothetical protein